MHPARAAVVRGLVPLVRRAKRYFAGWDRAIDAGTRPFSRMQTEVAEVLSVVRRVGWDFQLTLRDGA